MPRAGPGDMPSVAVHGLALGGSAKTPLCAWLAGRWADRGDGPIAVATRGVPTVADEIAWLRGRLPGTVVVSDDDPRRALGLARQAGCRAVVLDDPSVSRPAAAHLRILCLAPGDGWDVPAFPAGDRRPGGLRPGEVDRVVLLDGAAPHPAFPPSRSDRARLRPLGFAPIARPFDVPCPGVPFARAFLVCGVARPSRVLGSLRTLGVDPVGRWALPDHRAWPAFVRVAAERWAMRRGADAIVVTEKDAVRLPPGFAGDRLAWWVLRTELEVESCGEALAAAEEALSRPAGSAGRPAEGDLPRRPEGRR
jgi:tetraacyldisaccharide-1-P 4'-kinase